MRHCKYFQWWQVLKTPYRNSEPRMLKVLDHLACNRCSPEVISFMWVAIKVKFPEDPEGRIPLQERVRHFVWSNRMRDSMGRTVYLQSGPVGDLWSIRHLR